MKVFVRRAYDDAKKSDGLRVLVDRLWPRGVKKSEAAIDVWVKDLAPSNSLRSWFHKDPENRFSEFKKRYKKELSGTKKLARNFIPKRQKITIITAARDLKYSHIPVIKDYLEKL